MAKKPLQVRLFGRATPQGDCWVHPGERTAKGYARLDVDGRHHRAHRLAWELINGPIPPGMVICHKCDNPPCIRPSHLWLGTVAENNRDMVAKGRHFRSRKEAA